MPSYAYYRLPHSEHYTFIEQTEGNPEQLSSYLGLDGRRGFVVAPFAVSAATPVLLIHPDKVEERELPDDFYDASHYILCENMVKTAGDRIAYAHDFSKCHAMLQSGEFKKIVLARSAYVETPGEQQAERLFMRACKLYPRMFVSLIFTPISGMWLMATPEILLEGRGNEWRTIALAGTMRLEGSLLRFDDPPLQGGSNAASGIFWNTKNIQEQRCVATYIADCLKMFTTDCREEGPRTVRAGNLVHLRSDFTFRLSDRSHIGSILSVLHPTPAVCGLPKAETWRYILEHEQTDRRYYSGFVGPLAYGDDTNLYVSLRCMQIIDSRHYCLYAGGGILNDSDEETEWLETEAKMETMKRILSFAD